MISLPRTPGVASRAVLLFAIAAGAGACGASTPEPVAPAGTSDPSSASGADATTGGAGGGTTRGSTDGTTKGTAEGTTEGTTKGATVGTGPVTTGRGGSTSTTDEPDATSTTSDDGEPTPMSVAPEYAEWCSDFRNDLPNMGASGDFSETQAIFDRLASSSPEPIADDWHLLNQVVQSAATIEDLPNGEDYDDAFERISQWTIANCGFDPDDL